MSYQKRFPNPDDAVELGRLHNRIWRESYQGIIPSDILLSRKDADAIEKWRKRLLDLNARGVAADDSYTLVATLEDQIVGFINVGHGRDRRWENWWEIWALYVAPEHHGKGVAQVLTDGLPTDQQIYLWVISENHRAIAFYKKKGFTLSGESRIHNGFPNREVMMVAVP